jgi:hypothetical protein
MLWLYHDKLFSKNGKIFKIYSLFFSLFKKKMCNIIVIKIDKIINYTIDLKQCYMLYVNVS